VIALVRAEWLKLRTTAVPWVLGAIAIVITGLLIAVFFASHDVGGDNAANATFGPPTPTIPHTVQQLRDLVGQGLVGYLLALLLGVLIITTEFRHKTVTTTFLVTPQRPRMVVGKLLLAALAGIGLAVLALAATVIGGGITIVAKGGSFSPLLHQVPAVAPGVILVFVLFALLGVGVGSLITNQVAALIVILGWFLVVQSIISGIWPGTTKWLPTGAAAAAASVTQRRMDVTLFAWWQGSLLILAYGLVFAAVGSFVLTRRDIT
jgi:ABC-type transport system involved in multi-copper enzyme maturation permease subunit